MFKHKQHVDYCFFPEHDVVPLPDNGMQLS